MFSPIKRNYAQLLLLLTSNLALAPALAHQSSMNTLDYVSRFYPSNASIVLQLGGFSAWQGKSQNIEIDTLIGDHFSVTKHSDQNVLVGLGYFVDGFCNNYFDTLFGINAFYLAETYVKGNVEQEHLFTNLSYHYAITNWPIYLASKSYINLNSDRYTMTFDFGIGPNIIQTSNFKEFPLDEFTIPDNAFKGKTDVAFSVTTGVGFTINNLLWNYLPLEIGYRFFYLGQGGLQKETDAILNSFKTGSGYANALIFSTEF